MSNNNTIMEKPINHQAAPHVLFDFAPSEPREEIDDKLQRTYTNLKQLIANKTPKECQEAYMKLIATNPQQNLEELTMGLVVALLAEQDGAKYYRDIVAISKDGLGLFGTYLNMIIIERLSRLREHSMRQIFWTFNQLLKAGPALGEAVCSNLIRQTVGGNLSPKNLWLCETLLDTLIENRNWVINSTTFMIPTCVYTFLRLVSDHMGPAHSALRQKEVDFVVGLIREKFLESIQIGRDLLRLLHNVIKIPEFEKLWNDILNNPKSLHPSFEGPLQLLNTKTPRRLFQSRLNFELEKKITHLAQYVKFGNQKRYQDWIYKQYLATPESLSLRCDLIRYICTIIHPSNEVLCSDIIPRWAILGWLLTTCTTPVSCNNAKLSLFFDWISHDPKIDNIMNIEPAILVMYQSIRSHPTVTMMLLDYLCRLPTTWLPKYSEQIKTGIKKCLQHVLEKKVVPAFVPLYEFANPPLKALLRESYPESFCGTPVHLDNGISNPALANPTNPITVPNQRSQPVGPQTNHANVPPSTPKQVEVITLDNDKNSTVDNSLPIEAMIGTKASKDKTIDLVGIKKEFELDSNPSPTGDEAKAFSWNGSDNSNATYSHKQNHDSKMRKTRDQATWTTDDLSSASSQVSTPNNVTNDVPNNNHRLTSDSPLSEFPNFINHTNKSGINVIYPFFTVEELDFKKTINTFEDGPLKGILEDFSNEQSMESRCSWMDKLISTILDNSEHSNKALGASLKTFGHCLAYLVSLDFLGKIFSQYSQDIESLEESIASPFFVLCRSVFSNSKAGWTSRTMSLLVSIAQHLEGAGFLVLYFLRVSHLVNGTSVSSGYIEFCNAAKRKLIRCLYDDLWHAKTYDPGLFCFLLPSVFGELASSGSFTVTGNVDFIRMAISEVDPMSLQDLVCLCLTGTTKIIDKDEPLPLIQSSLSWESYEQFNLWQLIGAQGVPIENYITILPKLKPKEHHEAITFILLNLQKVAEPSTIMIQQILDCECKANDLYTTSILRYWSIKTDVKELAKMISSLSDSGPPSPQVKRKGQTKAASESLPALSTQSEKILNHLESIRQRAPKNKLLVQPAISEMLSQLEPLCNDAQKKKFFTLFANRPKQAKKLKKTTKEVTNT